MLAKYLRSNACTALAVRTAVLASQSYDDDAVRRHYVSELRHPSDRPRRSRNPVRGAGAQLAPQYAKSSSSLSAAPKSCSPATAPASGRRGRAEGAGIQQCGLFSRVRQRRLARAKTSQRISAPGAADTGGTPSGTKPRRWARTPTSRSPPRARHLLIRAAQSRGEYQRSAPPRAPAAPPRPRAASASISQTCARRRRRPPTPFYHMLGARRFYAVERSQLVRRRR